MRAQPFDYGLEPLRQQATWKLDAALAELAAAARKLEASKAAAQVHQDHVEALLIYMKPTSASNLDPAIARNRIAYLAQAADKTKAFEQDIAEAEEKIKLLQEDCREKQLKVDAIEQHRQEAAQEHSLSQARRSTAQADDDWLLRSRWAAQKESEVT